MILQIKYQKIAIKFLKKNYDRITKKDVDSLILKAIKKILKKENSNIDLKRLVSKNEYFRIRKGDIRIVFSYDLKNEIVVSIVENIDFRGNVYK